ncbi:MAG: hypothetical protein ABS934_03720 [Psychrobacillus sp.]
MTNNSYLGLVTVFSFVYASKFFNALSMLKLLHLLIGATDGDSYGMSETDKTSQPRA